MKEKRNVWNEENKTRKERKDAKKMRNEKDLYCHMLWEIVEKNEKNKKLLSMEKKKKHDCYCLKEGEVEVVNSYTSFYIIWRVFYSLHWIFGLIMGLSILTFGSC